MPPHPENPVDLPDTDHVDRELASLVAPLSRAPLGSAPSIGRLIDAARRRRRRRRVRQATLASLAVIAFVAIGNAATGDGEEVRVKVAARPTTLGPSTTVTTLSGDVTRTTTASTPSANQVDPPPWREPPVDGPEVAAVRAAWTSTNDATRGVCPALVPTELGAGENATARVAERSGSDMWWVAWDMPGARGESAIQTPCEDCGRETFMVSAQVRLPSFAEVTAGWANSLQWSDGSNAGYGVLGRGGVGSAEKVGWLAYLAAASAPDCFYQVHSYLSEEHLMTLLRSLHRVVGAP